MPRKTLALEKFPFEISSPFLFLALNARLDLPLDDDIRRDAFLHAVGFVDGVRGIVDRWKMQKRSSQSMVFESLSIVLVY